MIRFLSRTRLLCAAGIGFAALPVSAADAPPAIVASAEPDALLALKAKAAIAADRELCGLNLLVSVVDRSALVGGPVPDIAMESKIDAVVRRVPGLMSVTVKCYVPATEDPFAKLVGDRVSAPPAAAPGSTLPPLIVAIPPERPTPSTSPSPVVAKPAEAPGNGKITVQKVTPPATAGFLLDPVATGGVAVRSTGLPTPGTAMSLPSAASTGEGTIPPPAVPTVPEGMTLAERIAEVRGRDARFTGFTVKLSNGTAVVMGTASRAEDAWDYASALGSVPGITRVVVGQVTERPR